MLTDLYKTPISLKIPTLSLLFNISHSLLILGSIYTAARHTCIFGSWKHTSICHDFSGIRCKITCLVVSNLHDLEAVPTRIQKYNFQVAFSFLPTSWTCSLRFSCMRLLRNTWLAYRPLGSQNWYHAPVLSYWRKNQNEMNSSQEEY